VLKANALTAVGRVKRRDILMFGCDPKNGSSPFKEWRREKTKLPENIMPDVQLRSWQCNAKSTGKELI